MLRKRSGHQKEQVGAVLAAILAKMLQAQVCDCQSHVKHPFPSPPSSPSARPRPHLTGTISTCAHVCAMPGARYRIRSNPYHRSTYFTSSSSHTSIKYRGLLQKEQYLASEQGVTAQTFLIPACDECFRYRAGQRNFPAAWQDTEAERHNNSEGFEMRSASEVVNMFDAFLGTGCALKLYPILQILIRCHYCW